MQTTAPAHDTLWNVEQLAQDKRCFLLSKPHRSHITRAAICTVAPQRYSFDLFPVSRIINSVHLCSGGVYVPMSLGRWVFTNCFVSGCKITGVCRNNNRRRREKGIGERWTVLLLAGSRCMTWLMGVCPINKRRFILQRKNKCSCLAKGATASPFWEFCPHQRGVDLGLPHDRGCRVRPCPSPQESGTGTWNSGCHCTHLHIFCLKEAVFHSTPVLDFLLAS